MTCLRRPRMLVLVFCALSWLSAAETVARNAVVVVVDGARWSETWGDATHALVPRLATDLANEGVVMTGCRNQGPTVTNPGHAAISTGRYHPHLDNQGKGLPGAPSFLQVWRDQTRAEASAAWVLTGKPKLDILANCADPTWKDRAVPAADCGQTSDGRRSIRDDAATIDAALAALREHRPRLLLINLADVDTAGHGGKLEEYRAAIARADAAVFRLWTYLRQTDGYAGQTLFVLTNDHGRHSDDAPESARGGKPAFADHGCSCDGCRHVVLFMAGPGLPRGAIDDQPCELIDIAPTVAEALGVTMPSAQGNSLRFAVPVP